ncbi:peptidoglycan editing factor PgeF [Noviherbaspirillum saxi]|uniref:Purine nucleoside phosphorylase n=1 Tax=Noviherbaspirillum saxi TaxID=2320863 RepID=A0A3A3FV22_9BURK|nr:peptidoglycan editing factor PgeF [Noviherbaspirillum saxi]RJG00043.1 peptidoglycan editing factor PgeF [Noviherbaspirillum saxi]
MDLIIPQWEAPANVGCLSTTRIGGSSRAPYDDGHGGGGLNLGTHVGDDPAAVAHNRGSLRAFLPGEPAWLTQVHGTHVVDVESLHGKVPEADASIASTPGQVCVIQTADCLPVLFCDGDGSVVGAAHAGWRGLANGVLENTVARMRDAGAASVMAWLGPAIGPTAFEVGPEVFDVFTGTDSEAARAFNAIPGSSGKYFANIYALARLKLAQAGVTQIYGGDLCTVTDRRHFYSYRRDGVTGRMASLIWRK